jgi:hypothetical protein
MSRLFRAFVIVDLDYRTLKVVFVLSFLFASSFVSLGQSNLLLELVTD